jgi:ribosomal protein L39E
MPSRLGRLLDLARELHHLATLPGWKMDREIRSAKTNRHWKRDGGDLSYLPLP